MMGLPGDSSLSATCTETLSTRPLGFYNLTAFRYHTGKLKIHVEAGQGQNQSKYAEAKAEKNMLSHAQISIMLRNIE